MKLVFLKLFTDNLARFIYECKYLFCIVCTYITLHAG